MAKDAKPEVEKPKPKQKRAKPGEIPEHIKTLADLVNAYKRRWPEYPLNVSRQLIKHWQAGRRVKRWKGKGQAPWHPLADGRGYFIWKDCEAWFAKVILPRFTERGPGMDNGVDEMDFEEEEKREKHEHNQFLRRKERGEYILRSSEMATILAAIKRLHIMIRSEDERQLPIIRRDKLAEILKIESINTDTADKIVEEYLAYEIALGKIITDRRETAMAEAGKSKAENETT